MRIRTAVADYQKMFPDEYRQLIQVIKYQRENLKTDMAEIEGHALERALFTISETLSTMIGKKLSIEEMTSFKEKENSRWFAKEFPQFTITKNI